MTAVIKIGDYYIHERQLKNGWYELSAMAWSMGEEYMERKRFDYRPQEEDYRKFVQYIEGNK